MLPEAKSQDLLYVSEPAAKHVVVFSYPVGKRLGVLNDLGATVGECVDSAGDVFIVSDPTSPSLPTTIYEFTHGGTVPIATLSDPGGGYGCSIDAATGNLAVSNFSDPSNPYGGYGDVAIFARAQGNPTMYYPPASFPTNFYFCGYDDQGNLYLSGTSSSCEVKRERDDVKTRNDENASVRALRNNGPVLPCRCIGRIAG